MQPDKETKAPFISDKWWIRMFFYAAVTLAFLWLVTVVMSCGPVNRIFGVKDDAVIEESTEAIIHSQTGIDIDLTPSTKE